MDGTARAHLSTVDRAILAYVETLTLRPAETTVAHVESLRAVGLSDEAIHDVAQVTALFAYYNRLADGLGIESEPEWLASAGPTKSADGA